MQGSVLSDWQKNQNNQPAFVGAQQQQQQPQGQPAFVDAAAGQTLGLNVRPQDPLTPAAGAAAPAPAAQPAQTAQPAQSGGQGTPPGGGGQPIRSFDDVLANYQGQLPQHDATVQGLQSELAAIEAQGGYGNTEWYAKYRELEQARNMRNSVRDMINHLLGQTQ